MRFVRHGVWLQKTNASYETRPCKRVEEKKKKTPGPRYAIVSLHLHTFFLFTSAYNSILCEFFSLSLFPMRQKKKKRTKKNNCAYSVPFPKY